MSAPDTNLEEQEREHRGPLLGMAAAVIFAFILGGLLGAWLFAMGNDPGSAEERIDGRTGAVEETG